MGRVGFVANGDVEIGSKSLRLYAYADLAGLSPVGSASLQIVGDANYFYGAPKNSAFLDEKTVWAEFEGLYGRKRAKATLTLKQNDKGGSVESLSITTTDGLVLALVEPQDISLSPTDPREAGERILIYAP